MSRRDDVVSQALGVRRWSLTVLAGGAAGAAPTAGERAWRTALDVERCALPVREAIRAGRAELDAAAHQSLDRLATAEMKRVLAARAQLKQLDRMAGRLRTSVVVLKGGATVSHAALDVMDVDLLVRPSTLQAFATAAEAEGYVRVGRDPLWPTSGSHHLANRVLPGSIPVEFHRHIPLLDSDPALWERAVPLAGLSHSFRLAPVDHVWHLLLHGAVHHPFRRGRLRDLVLTAHALEQCGEADRAVVRARVSSHPHASTLSDVLDASEALVEGRPTDDRFETFAAANYLMVVRPGWRGIRAGDTMRCTSALLGRGADRADMLGRVWRNPDASSEVGAIAAVERRLPPVGRVMRRLARLVRYASALPRAATIAIGAKRLVGRSAGIAGRRAPR